MPVGNTLAHTHCVARVCVCVCVVSVRFAACLTHHCCRHHRQTLGVTDGGPVACSPGTGAPISGGPYGGLAYSIAGTATVSTESGKFEEVGRVEFTPFFVAVGQKLKATQDLPWYVTSLGVGEGVRRLQ